MNRKYLGLAALVAVLLTPLLVRFTTAAGSNPTVSVTEVMPRAIRSSILASGNIVYEDQAQLSPEIIGRVTSVLVREGDQVASGQVVLTIDDAAYRAEVAQRESVVRMQRLAIARRQLDTQDLFSKARRAEQLTERGFVTKVELESKRYEYESSLVGLRSDRESLRQAEAALSQARIQLGKTVIRAPVGGTVVAISIKAGETAVPSTTGIAGSSLMTIARTDSLIAELKVDEADIAQVRVGQTVSIEAASFPERTISGRVESLALSPRQNAPAAGAGSDSASRSYLVKTSISLANNLPLRSGMTCRAEIFHGENSRVPSIPIQAIRPLPEGESASAAPDATKGLVFVFERGVAKRRVVVLGRADDEYQQVVGGLKRGDRIITGPARILRNIADDDKVTLAGER